MTVRSVAGNRSVRFNVATVWDNEQIVRWANWSVEGRRVESIFGCRNRQLMGHGRAPGDVPAVSDEKIVQHAATAHSVGIKFLYLLNGLCFHLDLERRHVRSEIMEQLDWIVEEVKADGVVVAHKGLAELIRTKYKPEQLGVTVSTIAGIRTPEQLEAWACLGIEGLVIDYDLNRDFSAISRLAAYCDRYYPSIRLEVLVNESCLSHCFARATHYAQLAKAAVDYKEGFQQNCNIPRLLDPALMLGALWIRPEDLPVYRKCGVNCFKIAGREMNAKWLDRAVAAYIAGEHKGNLVELWTMTPPAVQVPASDIVHLDNSALSRFLDELKTNDLDAVVFYRSEAGRLWNRGAFEIADPGAKYEIKNGTPACVRPGHFLRKLMDFREGSDPIFDRWYRRRVEGKLVVLR